MSEAAHSPEFDALLRHESFVRALARSLVHGEDRVDDVSQEVWVAALRSPPRQAGNPRGWLGAVLRNVVRMGHRSDTRRRTRETDVPVAHAPSAAEVAAKIEIRRSLVDAVEALAEPYRSVVVLRYFDGLRPVDIAHRLGVPAKTVSTRLRRALEQLRARLDREDRPDRAGWRMLLLAAPLAAPSARAATLTGAIFVTAKVKVAVTALVVCAVSVALWKGLGDPGGGPSTPPPVVADLPEPEPDPALPVTEVPATEEPGPTAPPPSEASAAWTLHVEVLDPAGKPVPEARVAFLGGESLSETTGEDGRAVLEVEGAGDLAVSGAAGFAPKLAPGLPPPDSGEGSVRVDLERGLSIHGLLIDRLGGAVVDAEVRCRPFSTPAWAPRREWRKTRTDERGEFEVWGLLAGRYEFFVFPPQSAGETPLPRVEAEAGDRNIVIALRPIEFPVLRLLDRETGEYVGVPAQVHILRDGKERPIWGMLNGTEAKLPGIRPGTARVRVVAEGYLPLGPFDLDPADEDLVYDVLLDRDAAHDARNAKLTLKVHDDSGVAIERVLVYGNRVGYVRKALALEGGEVTIDLRPGKLRLSVDAVDEKDRPVFDLEDDELELDLRPGEHAVRAVLLRRLATIHAAVPEGGGYTVKLCEPDGSPADTKWGVTVGGKQLRSCVRPGTWILRAEYEDGTVVDRKFTAKAGETLELSLLPGVDDE